MRKRLPFQLLFLLAGAFFLHLTVQAQDASRYAIIPKPVKLTPAKGEFTLTSKTKLILGSSVPELKTATDFLVNLVESSAGYKMEYGTQAKKNTIAFTLDNTISNEEGYRLEVTTKKITVAAKTPKGAFLAIQTLRQLLPTTIETKNSGQKSFKIPAVSIEDAPRFAYRGMMLDVARHFQPIDFVKKYIDLLAFYKINTFHFHLTEDQGWRIEIKKYPKLQEIAAWRNETKVGHRRETEKGYDGKRHGGYYTQEELKDLVKYAQNRFITVIPEIEMPGHSMAALAAYPELGCKDTTYQVAGTWGVFKDIYCPNEVTFKFLEDVLTEVMAIFPSKYIHIGGDEAPKDVWKQSARAQEVMQREGLKDEHELQSYFIQRMEKFLNAKGRAIIGWDEILEGGLAPNATVMSWRGEKGGIAAAKQRHDVIMTPNSHLYFDHYQTKQGIKNEPLAIGGFLPLDKVYSYNPVPKSLTPEEAKHVLGVQANLWSEYIPTKEHAEHMAFPRACALAEVAWTPVESKDYTDFISRLEQNLKRLDNLKVNYSTYFREQPAPALTTAGGM
ncbi:beta-N-acetylglucosaminidase [Rufibacter immobilis]|uniref:beta-N-acetylhexosaminidase n=1 Tax=Rufibacter immobilis TaxID=1348778 RepID=A0A3M9MWH7_9BACT|nr:beta-N-acetylhexosaminidase [Rufibacter immobilis]RNI29912.1 beta-N-acetylglucosaminidase [Rufibacter immobilis]